MVFSFFQARVTTHSCLVQGLTCNSHDNDESLLLSVHDSDGGLSRGHGVILLPLGGSSRDGLLLIDIDREVGGVPWHNRQDDDG
jgi:hypothetical protein